MINRTRPNKSVDLEKIYGLSTDPKPIDCNTGSTFIEDDTGIGWTFDSVNTNPKTGNGWFPYLIQVKEGANEFEISVEITRPANTTAYAVNDIINTDNLDYLPALDFGASNAGKKIQINSAILLSNNGGASTKLSAMVHLFNASTLTGQSHLDNAAFNPTYAQLKSKGAAILDSLINLVNYGSNAYQLFQTEMQRNATLDSSGKLYAAVIATNTYTPTSGETLTLTLKGYLL